MRLQRRKAEGSVGEEEFGETMGDLKRHYLVAMERWFHEWCQLVGDLRRMDEKGSIVDADVKADLKRRLEEGANWNNRVNERLRKRGVEFRSRLDAPMFQAIDWELNELQRRKVEGSVGAADFSMALDDIERRFHDADSLWKYEAGVLQREIELLGDGGDATARVPVQLRLKAGNQWRQTAYLKLANAAQLRTVQELR